MKRISKKILDDVKPYKPGKPIGEVKRELNLDKVIKLASNENPMGPSARVIEAMAEAAREVNRYPDGGCFNLRKMIAEELVVPGDNIVFGNGSDEVIIFALRAFVEPGDEVIIADPTFLVYGIGAAVEGAKIKTVPLLNHKYDLDVHEY